MNPDYYGLLEEILKEMRKQTELLEKIQSNTYEVANTVRFDGYGAFLATGAH